jgi:hypothetical protein
MWAPAANLDGLDAAYTSCPRPSSCGAWNGSARLSRDAGGEQLGPVPLIQLIGTRKGGTTALSSLLREHPSIIMPNCTREQELQKRDPSRPKTTGMCWWDKEVRYFSRGLRRFDACWYRALYSCPREAAGTRFVGFDGSPDYFTLNAATVDKMVAMLGRDRTRLIALLRNPSDRFYSAYNMGMSEQRGKRFATYERFATSLDRYIACAPECRDESRVVSMFFDYGLYARHLRVFIDAFGRHAIHVEASEAMKTQPWEVVQRILSFAGLAESARLRAAVDAHSLAIGADADAKRNVGGVWGSAYAGRLREPERAKLTRFYAPHIRELYTLVGRDFGWEVGMVEATGARDLPVDAGATAAVRTHPPLRPEL